jgi:hypothetical protein
MSETKRRRGRPKGTGIDDSRWLSEIDQIRKVHPEMKVTTIIKTVFGIENQSMVRRLRDKHNKLSRQRTTAAPALRPEPGSRHAGHGRQRPAPANRTLSLT